VELAKVRKPFLEAVSDFDFTELSRKQGNQTADALIDVYEKQHERFVDHGVFLVKIITMVGSNQKAKQFVLSILRGHSTDLESLQRPVMLALYRGINFRQDPEVFDALLDLYRKGSQDIHDSRAFISLSALSKVDLARATPILKGRIETCTDIYSFNRLSSIVSATHDADLLESVFVRFHDFRATAPTMDGDPSIGIDNGVVIGYLDKAENEKLETALDVLFVAGGNPPLSREILLRKLTSRSVRSRKAALNYLRREMNRGAFVDREMISKIDDLAKNEEDAGISAMEKSIVADFGNGRLVSH
jgi:hypothetical protein